MTAPDLLNWAGNHGYRTTGLAEPQSIEELQDIVRGGGPVRALGTRHAFNDLTDSRGALVSLRRLPRRIEVDPDRQRVTVDGGLTYGELGDALDSAGFALPNLASLPHISIAGACATSTHGSGIRLGSLATAVRALTLVRGDGELATFDSETDAEAFDGAVVGLGSLGIVVALSLAIEPTYSVRQDVDEDLPFATFSERFETIEASADSVSCFTDWSAPAFHQVWRKRRLAPGDAGSRPAPIPGARPATLDVHPIPGFPAAACTPQLGRPGPWHERLPHFRLDHRPSAGEELQSEYLLPREHTVDAVEALATIAVRLRPLVLVSEIRTVAADRLWLSPANGRDTVAIHFTWRRDWEAVRTVLPQVEAALRPFDPRPHWGKLFTMPGDEVSSRYENRRRFTELAAHLDPERRFRNDFVDAFVFGAD